MSQKLLVAGMAICLLFTFIVSGIAEVPKMINYLGRLTDGTGASVADGSYQIKFNIYGSAAGNDSLWWSGFQAVAVAGGLFEYQLGANVPLPDDLFETDTTRYLGITVDTDPEIIPRVRLLSTPYAYQAFRSDKADNASKLGGESPYYFVNWNNMNNVPEGFADGIDDIGTGDITAVTAGSGLSGGGTSGDVDLYIGAGDITSSHIATGAVGTDEIATDGVAAAEIRTDAVGSDEIASDAVGSDEIASNAVGSSEIATGAVGTAEIADGSITNVDYGDESIYSIHIGSNTINNSDISSVANIETSKIEGTAVNLSSTQTITGWKTFEGTIHFGDSTMTVNNDGVRMGNRTAAPSTNYILSLGRTYNSLYSHYGLYAYVYNNYTYSDADIHSMYGTYGQAFSVNGYYGDRVGAYGRAGEDADYRGNSFGVYGEAYGGDAAVGVFGRAMDSDDQDYGIYASCGVSDGNYGAYFFGNCETTGGYSKAGGGFKIDHPADPENKYLIHSDVQSPDMMNVYNGNVSTDGDGYAVVNLPDYFDALNKDFRYQLTVIGDFAQAIIAEEIMENAFVIRTDKPNVKVSWQVTGIRADLFAETNRIKVEVNKSAEEIGYYLHPEIRGFGLERSTNYKYHKNIVNDEENDEFNNE